MSDAAVGAGVSVTNAGMVAAGCAVFNAGIEVSPGVMVKRGAAAGWSAVAVEVAPTAGRGGMGVSVGSF